MRIVWSPEAREDVAEIYRHYAEIDSEYAYQAAERAMRAARLLAERPKLGPVVETTAFRKWRAPKTPYILIYRVDDDRLRIVRVAHHARDWQAFL